MRPAAGTRTPVVGLYSQPASQTTPPSYVCLSAYVSLCLQLYSADIAAVVVITAYRMHAYIYNVHSGQTQVVDLRYQQSLGDKHSK